MKPENRRTIKEKLIEAQGGGARSAAPAVRQYRILTDEETKRPIQLAPHWLSAYGPLRVTAREPERTAAGTVPLGKTPWGLISASLIKKFSILIDHERLRERPAMECRTGDLRKRDM
jgi:hypothetical protein